MRFWHPASHDAWCRQEPSHLTSPESCAITLGLTGWIGNHCWALPNLNKYEQSGALHGKTYQSGIVLYIMQLCCRHSQAFALL